MTPAATHRTMRIGAHTRKLPSVIAQKTTTSQMAKHDAVLSRRPFGGRISFPPRVAGSTNASDALAGCSMSSANGAVGVALPPCSCDETFNILIPPVQ